MKRLAKLKLQLGTLVKTFEGLVNARAEEGKNFSEEKTKELNETRNEIESIKAEIKDLELIQEEQAKDLSDKNKPSKEDKTVSKPIVLEKGIHAAAYFRCMVAAKHHDMPASEFAEKAYGENHPVTKTLMATSGSGQNTIPANIASELIELLSNRTIVRKMMPTKIGVPHGKLTVNRKTGATQAAYVGEKTALDATDMSIGNCELSLKKLMAVTSVTKEMLDWSVHNVDVVIREDLLDAMAQAEDAHFIRGVGSSTAPTSLYEIATAAGLKFSVAAGTSPSVTDVEAVLKKLLQNLESNNVTTQDAVFYMSSRTKNFLMFLRDANGNKAFPEMKEGLLLDRKFEYTESVPSNLGVGTNESELGLVSPSGLYLGEDSGMKLESTDTGSYQVGGQLKSTFAEDSVAFKVVGQHDFEARHPKCCSVAEGIQWDG